MRTDTYAVILLFGTSHAIRAERVLYLAGIACKLIPVPRHISSNCGVCVRSERVDKETALDALEKAQVQIEGIHDI